MLIFFDSETTGLPDFRAPSESDHQPFLVQLAALLTEDDGAEVASLSAIVAPHGYTEMPPLAFKAHGISHEDAVRKGLGLATVMALFLEMAARATTRIAHNVPFDDKLVKIACCRAGMVSMVRDLIERQPSYCTLKVATPIVNLPPTEKMLAAGFNKPKACQLGEAYKHFFNEELVGAHDALVDVRACKRIYFHLQQLQAA